MNIPPAGEPKWRASYLEMRELNARRELWMPPIDVLFDVQESFSELSNSLHTPDARVLCAERAIRAAEALAQYTRDYVRREADQLRSDIDQQQAYIQDCPAPCAEVVKRQVDDIRRQLNRVESLLERITR